MPSEQLDKRPVPVVGKQELVLDKRPVPTPAYLQPRVAGRPVARAALRRPPGAVAAAVRWRRRTVLRAFLYTRVAGIRLPVRRGH